MAFYSRNHDYVFVDIPGNGTRAVLDLLVDIERRFHSSAGAPQHAAKQPGAYFHERATPAMLRDDGATGLMLWSNPLLRVVRGYQYLRLSKSPFLQDEDGKERGLTWLLEKLVATPDAERPDSVRSQSFYAQDWLPHVKTIGALEDAERYIRRFAFRVFGVSIEVPKSIKGFFWLDFSGCAGAVNLELMAMLQFAYREDVRIMEAIWRDTAPA